MTGRSAQRWPRVAVVVLVASYIAASAANLNEAFMGSYPTVSGLVATLVYIAAWVGVGWATGQANSARFTRRVVIVWALLLAIMIFGFAVIAVHMPGNIVAALLLMAVNTQFHGVAGFLPVSLPAEYLLVAVGTGSLVGAAHWLARRRS
jgi:hypothetical protein